MSSPRPYILLSPILNMTLVPRNLDRLLFWILIMWHRSPKGCNAKYKYIMLKSFLIRWEHMAFQSGAKVNWLMRIQSCTLLWGLNIAQKAHSRSNFEVSRIRPWLIPLAIALTMQQFDMSRRGNHPGCRNGGLRMLSDASRTSIGPHEAHFTRLILWNQNISIVQPVFRVWFSGFPIKRKRDNIKTQTSALLKDIDLRQEPRLRIATDIPGSNSPWMANRRRNAYYRTCQHWRNIGNQSRIAHNEKQPRSIDSTSLPRCRSKNSWERWRHYFCCLIYTNTQHELSACEIHVNPLLGAEKGVPPRRERHSYRT